MFILFKDGRSTDVPSVRMQIDDGLALAYTYQDKLVAVVDVASVAAVFDSSPYIIDAPKPPPPLPPSLTYTATNNPT